MRSKVPTILLNDLERPDTAVKQRFGALRGVTSGVVRMSEADGAKEVGSFSGGGAGGGGEGRGGGRLARCPGRRTKPDRFRAGGRGGLNGGGCSTGGLG